MSVTVVMPSYNAERFIAQAIESVLDQSWQDFELIVLDDGSKDRTREIAEDYSRRDPRVRVESHTNMGPGPTLNRGLGLASSEWVILMHADDLMMPNRIERQLAFVAEHPDLAVASSWVMHINSSGKVIARDNSRLTTYEAVEKRFRSNEMVGISHPAAILRKSAVLAIGGYRPQFRTNEDADLWNRLLERGYKILVQPEFLLKYRLHGSSATISRNRYCWVQLRWVKNCMLRRRRGEPELTWEQFQAMRKKLPWYLRLNQERKDWAKTFHKAAGFHYAQREYLRLAGTLCAAILLQPVITTSQVFTKLAIRQN